MLATSASTWAQQLIHTFNDPTPSSADLFGVSAALDSNHVLVGAKFDDTSGEDVGQAHLFDAQTGAVLHTFDDPTVTMTDIFGFSVALFDNRVLVGAPGDDTNGVDVGEAHLFDAGTGALLRTFNDPAVTNRDLFGWSVALQGNHVVIGASGDDTFGNNMGQAHLFDAVSGALLQTFNDPTVTNGIGSFGDNVAVSGDYVVVGEPFDETNGPLAGQAHLFDATTGALVHTFNDPTATTQDQFGTSVAVDGNHVLVGAQADDTSGDDVGQAHLFDATTGALLQTFDDPTVTTRDNFGARVAIDGNNVLVGAPSDDTNGDNVGQAHLFDAATGALLHTFNDPMITNADVFGVSVALHGSRVLIGATGDDTAGTEVGQAHLFLIPEPNALALAGLAVAFALVALRRSGRRL